MPDEIQRKDIDKYDKPLPLWVIALIPVFISVLFIIIFFPLAQDWAWIEAWLFIVSVVINMTISFYVINKKNPRVLRNRAKVKKVGITDKTKRSAGYDKF